MLALRMWWREHDLGNITCYAFSCKVSVGYRILFAGILENVCWFMTNRLWLDKGKRKMTKVWGYLRCSVLRWIKYCCFNNKFYINKRIKEFHPFNLFNRHYKIHFSSKSLQFSLNVLKFVLYSIKIEAL